MLRENWGSVEGVVDVSVIVPVCFDNPLKKHAVEFVEEVLTLRRRALLPITALLGAYHIATKYLKAPRRAVKKILAGILETNSPALYPLVPPGVAAEALDAAVAYNIESWDGYLVALANTLEARTIYTMDAELEKVKELVVVNPFPRNKVKEYHKYLRSLLEAGPSGKNYT